MQFGYAIQYVENVEKTLEFYEKAFGFQRRMLVESKEYGELESGTTRLAFAAHALVRTLTSVEFTPSGSDRPAPPIELGFVTDDVESAFQLAVANGAVFVKSPETKPWGQVVSYVRDLNGFLVEICSPMT